LRFFAAFDAAAAHLDIAALADLDYNETKPYSFTITKPYSIVFFFLPKEPHACNRSLDEQAQGQEMFCDG
jgi:hypothetical protein